MTEQKTSKKTISETICNHEVKVIESYLGSMEKSLSDMRRELDGMIEKKIKKIEKSKGKQKSK